MYHIGPQGAAVGPLPPQGVVGQPMRNPAQSAGSVSYFQLAASFDQANTEYLSHAGNATLRGGATWWRACWYYAASTPANNASINGTYDGSDGYIIRLQLNGTQVNVLCGGSNADIATGLSLTTWYFLYVQYDGSRIDASIDNGALSGFVCGFAAGSGAFEVGARGDGGTAPFHGRIQGFVGGDGNLTAGEITALYAAGQGLAYDELTAAILAKTGFAYDLDEASGARADSHSGGYNLTDNNTVTSATGLRG